MRTIARGLPILGKQTPVMGGAGGSLSYQQRIKNLFGSAIVGYWPLQDTGGTTAVDVSGNGLDGSYTGPTLANAAGPKENKLVARFDGTSDFASLTGAGLAAAFNTAEGSMMIWFKVSAAAEWTDGGIRMVFHVRTDGSNEIYLAKSNESNKFLMTMVAGGTGRGNNSIDLSATTWTHIAITWSATNTRTRLFINGAQLGSDLGAPGTWSGALAGVMLGQNVAGNQFWSGWLADAIILNREATPAEIGQVYTLP